MRLAGFATLFLSLLIPALAAAQAGVELRGGARRIGAVGDYRTYGFVGADAEIFRGLFAGGDLSVHRYDPGTGRLERTGMTMVQGGYRYPGRLAGFLQPYARVGGGTTVWRCCTGLVMVARGSTRGWATRWPSTSTSSV